MGAEVHMCPTNVEPDDPRSYYSVARKLNNEIPNSFYPNQYNNPSNSIAHYETTGPEIWRDTEGKITHYAAGVGTGGSMCGTAKYLKEQKADIITVGIDTYGSVFKKYKETGKFDENEVYPYLTEGIGEDILPKNVDFDLIDTFVKVTDKEGALMTRRLAKEEGLFIGWSCGSAVYGALEYAKDNLKKDDVMVIILPDHGTRYLGKIYNDNWMESHGFNEGGDFATARAIIEGRAEDELFTLISDMSIGAAIKTMNEYGIDQVPIIEEGKFVGSISDSKILKSLIESPEMKDQPIEDIMDASFPFIALDSTVDVMSTRLNKDCKALLVRDENNKTHIITQTDLLMSLTK
jgi:cystathionine beta-synthase